MPSGRDDRQDPFAALDVGEPVQDLGLTDGRPVTSRRAGGHVRATPIRPSEKRRRARQLSVTFSSPEIADRLRALAGRWDVGPSTVVERLLLPRLEAAERSEIGPGED